MKNLSLKLAGLMLAGVFFVFSSCSDDPCKDVDCGQFGTCFEGDCNCVTGYEGDVCDIQWSAKFAGNYIGSDACTSGNYTNISSTIANPTATSITITNFAGYAATMTASLDTRVRIEINNPSFVSPDGTFAITGTGEISGNTLTITYTSVDASDGFTDTCTLTYTRQ